MKKRHPIDHHVALNRNLRLAKEHAWALSLSQHYPEDAAEKFRQIYLELEGLVGRALGLTEATLNGRKQ
jgi:hypothetical protein